MASFPTTLPADTAEVNSYIRFWLTNLSTTVISDSDMDDMINARIAEYTGELCKITYFSTIDILNWLIRSKSVADGSSGSSGAVNRRREKRGKTEIEIEYADNVEETTGWEAILADLLTTPSLIGCDPFSDVDDDDKVRAPIIGGADINGYEEGFRTRDKFGKAIKDNRFGYGRSRFGRRLF
jgi:hypothetical protein